MTTNSPTALEILDTPMRQNDAGARTIRGYLVALLTAVWDEGADFSGKRPFGSSGWKHEVYDALARAGHVSAGWDEDGYLDHVDADTADRLIRHAISTPGELSVEEAP